MLNLGYMGQRKYMSEENVLDVLSMALTQIMAAVLINKNMFAWSNENGLFFSADW